MTFSLKFNKITTWLVFLILPVIVCQSFNEAFITPKWIVVYFVLFIELIYLAGSKQIFYIKNTTFVLPLSLITLGTLISCFKNYSAVTIVGNLDFLIFWLLFFIYLTKNENKLFNILETQGPIYSGLSAVLGYSCFQFFNALIGAEFSPSSYASFFGNNNMVSEYVLLTLPLQLLFIKSETNKFIYILKAIMIIFSIFFLTAWFSRSAVLSLGTVLLLFFACAGFAKKEVLTISLAIIISLFGKLVLIPHAASEQLAADKSSSVNIRKSLTLAGISMVESNPLGIGSTQFLFNSIPYQKFTKSPADEDTLYKSPHNEILRLTIEYGWIAILGSLILFLYMLKNISLLKIDKEKFFFYSSYMLVFIIEILFQFPSENAFPYIFLAMILASFVSETERNIKVFTFENGSRNFVVYPLVFFTAVLISCFSFSYFLEYNYAQSSYYSKIACRIYPSNWRACLNWVQSDISNRDLMNAQVTLSEELTRRPFNYVALKLLTIANFEADRSSEACEAGRLYDELFNGRSSWNEYLKQRCPAPGNKSWTSADDFVRSYQQDLNHLLTLPTDTLNN